jgi:predicted RNA-binding Zn-ribbon protein involved in translation (DUF1610 family)
MEKEDVNSIANAVTGALAKLNADTAAKEPEKPETFKCPECGGEVTGGIAYCQSCGCELEWEA